MVPFEGRDNEVSLHKARERTVEEFRYALSTAEDSEISLIWNHHREEEMSTEDRTTWSRILMHCVSMLLLYSRQLVNVDLWHLNEDEYSFAKAWLSGLESPCGLQRLIVSACRAESDNTSTDFDATLPLYNIGYHGPYLCLGSSFLSLSDIQFSYTESPNIQALPPTLRELRLSGTSHKSNPFQGTPHHFLGTLQLYGTAVDAVMTGHSIDLSILHRLHLSGRSINVLLWLLSTINAPRLESLYLEPSSDYEAWKAPASVIETQPTLYQRLMKLEVRVYMDKQLPHVLSRLNSLINNSAPGLEHLHLRPLQSYRRMNESGDDEGDNRINKVLFRTPEKITLDLEMLNIAVDEVLSCLGEGTDMEELVIRVRFSSETPVVVKNIYDFPHMKALVLRGKNVHSLADHIRGPLLTSVELE